ncbi:DUF4055 domain-containing protein [Bosea sp. AS-1]|uniref:DUF4055 domain-containing protein n=1 Tax=Bosea sp. AS-1 TaxID=2015316 RepID=UPI000B79109A|nr:DUF4055 domain-containing protein [Bosea sp. AS-1]
MTAGSVAKTVRTPSRDYMLSHEKWDLPRALLGGTRAMRAKGEQYLPREFAEDALAYTVRLNRTVLFNAFAKTVRDMVGRMFTKPIQLGDDAPEKIKEWSENIDLTGRDLNTFAFEVAIDAMTTGVSFILAEMPPPLPEGATKADEDAAGQRPYLVHVKTEDLIGWKSTTIGGREVATQVRLLECAYEPDPDHPFEEKEVEQVRVIEPGRWETWRKKGDSESWIRHKDGVTTGITDRIPIVAVYFKRGGFFIGDPPFADLADLNCAHWQSSSDQRNILHVARVPILFGAGWDEKDTFVIGPGQLARMSSTDAKLSYVEHGGNSIEAGRNDLKDMETQMQAMGLQLLVSQPGQTATGEIRDDTKEISPLAMMADSLEDALEEAYGLLCRFGGERAEVTVNVNRDFGASVFASTDQTTLLAMADSGYITHETLLREMQRRKVLENDFEPEDEVEKLSGYDEELEDDEPTDRPGGASESEEGQP